MQGLANGRGGMQVFNILASSLIKDFSLQMNVLPNVLRSPMRFPSVYLPSVLFGYPGSTTQWIHHNE